MKIRVVIMTENDKHIDLPKKRLENVAFAGWTILCEKLSTCGDVATVESVEVVEE